MAGSNTFWFWRWTIRYFGGFLLLFLAFCLVMALPEIFPDHGVFYRAIVDGDIARVRTLLDRGGDPNSQRTILSDTIHSFGRTSSAGPGIDFDKQTPLVIIAIAKDEYDIARLLLERGADPNARDAWGRTVLASAAMTDDVELVRLLLSRGADPNARAADGSTALREGPRLQWRYRPVNPEIIELLRQADARKP